jgi:hypothetical protein
VNGQRCILFSLMYLLLPTLGHVAAQRILVGKYNPSVIFVIILFFVNVSISIHMETIKSIRILNDLVIFTSQIIHLEHP